MVNLRPTAAILLFIPSVSGGVAEYACYQARALKNAGAKITALVAPSFSGKGNAGFKTINCLSNPVTACDPGVIKKIRMVWRMIRDRYVLAWQIFRRNPDLVLMDSYAEYMSPFWVWPHWLLARWRGVRYAANLHDPVRNFVLGPAWWHRWSVRLAYLPLDFVLVHDRLPEPSPVPERIRVVQVPHGLYEISELAVDRAEVRRCWGVKEGQKVFLSFGYVRDSKNLDLAVRALVREKEAFLVVSGAVASTNDRPFSYYRKLAERIGVLGRCLFIEGYVAIEELGKYFTGADFVLLTYSSSFYSQSGVLNLAARARKPVLASASPSPFLESVKKFHLGVTVEPDSTDAVVAGMQQLLDSPLSPCWEAYEASASWTLNAEGVLRAAGLIINDQVPFSKAVGQMQ